MLPEKQNVLITAIYQLAIDRGEKSIGRSKASKRAAFIDFPVDNRAISYSDETYVELLRG